MLLTGAVALGATGALAADRAKAAVDCKATTEKLVYDCIIGLSNARTAEPLAGATVKVGADMPSMPMAHNVRPVTAEPTGKPGEYRARLTLEMLGDWAVRLTITGPVKDQVVEVRNFGQAGSGPASRKSGSKHGH
jgi:hypothetical protein